MNKSIEHVFLMGKSIEHLQCHRIYIQHIWRYGSIFFDAHFGMVPSEFPNLRRPVGAPTLEIHRGKHQKNWAKLDILGVDNSYPYKNRRVNTNMLQNDTTFWF